MRGTLLILALLIAGLAPGAARGAESEAPDSIARVQRLADEGDAEMQYRLGLWNFWALPSARDLGLALYWFCRAAERGHRAAQIHLGLMYWTGNGLPRDPLQAYLWFSLAARTAPGIAAEYRERMAHDHLTKAQVAMARALEAAWLRTPSCPVEAS